MSPLQQITVIQVNTRYSICNVEHRADRGNASKQKETPAQKQKRAQCYWRGKPLHEELKVRHRRL